MSQGEKAIPFYVASLHLQGGSTKSNERPCQIESGSEGEGARNATNHLARRRRPAEIPEVGGTRCFVLLKNNGESFASGYFIPHHCIYRIYNVFWHILAMFAMNYWLVCD